MTMSKPLSEQVATLETDLAEALADISWLEHEITDLRIENAELRAGQGRWPTGYADDDHQDAEARQDGHGKPVDTTPTTCKEKGENFTRPTRLTVHALNVAPVGSVVQNARGLGWRKLSDGRWVGALELQKWSSTELLMNTDDDATLHLPESQR